jgi:hypothetical protein
VRERECVWVRSREEKERERERERERFRRIEKLGDILMEGKQTVRVIDT